MVQNTLPETMLLSLQPSSSPPRLSPEPPVTCIFLPTSLQGNSCFFNVRSQLFQCYPISKQSSYIWILEYNSTFGTKVYLNFEGCPNSSTNRKLVLHRCAWGQNWTVKRQLLQRGWEKYCSRIPPWLVDFYPFLGLSQFSPSMDARFLQLCVTGIKSRGYWMLDKSATILDPQTPVSL